MNNGKEEGKYSSTVMVLSDVTFDTVMLSLVV